jgi:hypothetical protein
MTVLRQEYHDGVWREPAPLRSVARLDCYPWLVVGTVCIGAFMGQVDASIAQLVLPNVERDFHASIGEAVIGSAGAGRSGQPARHQVETSRSASGPGFAVARHSDQGQV